MILGENVRVGVKSSGKEMDEDLAVKRAMYVWQIIQSPCELWPRKKFYGMEHYESR